MTLQELRDYIRVQLDMDEEELPNAQLDAYLAEAYMRTISQEARWPFFETRWEVGSIAGAPITLPVDCDPVGIDSLVDAVNGYRLMQISPELGEDRFVAGAATATNPSYYSIEGSTLALWPRSTETDRNYNLRGHRYGADWVAAGPATPVDADPRLHFLLAHYAIALCYAQQEDEVLEGVYMTRWQASFGAARHAICAPRHHRPLIYAGGLPYIPSYSPIVWNLPA